MRVNLLAIVGAISYERVGVAPHSVEMHQIADGYAEPQEIGRKRMNLVQCPNCLRWNPLKVLSCTNCGKQVHPGGDR